mmetsp:Transcript_57946/g.138036  ORF Transcript_57946/g.138036 Transcript_57946/m.138036 type:complete len:290 (+) Transcript_57946:1828-2697(+)
MNLEKAVCSHLSRTNGLDARIDLAHKEAADENAEEDGHDVAGSPGLASGRIKLPVVSKVHTREEGQCIVRILHEPGESRAEPDPKTIPNASPACLSDGNGEPLKLLLLTSEGDHRAHAVQALLHHAGGLGVPALRLHLHLGNSLADEVRSHGHERQHGGEDERKQPAEAKGASKASKEGRQGHHTVAKLVSEGILDLGQVVLDLSRQCRNFLGIEPTDILVQDVLKIHNPELHGLRVREDLEACPLKRRCHQSSATHSTHSQRQPFRLTLDLFRTSAKCIDEIAEDDNH